MEKNREKILLTILSLLLSSLFSYPLRANYSNPVLKVLLFKTSAEVVLSNPNGLHIRGSDLTERRGTRNSIRLVSRGKALLNNAVFTKHSIWFSGRGETQVRKRGSRFTCKYWGRLEIKPYKKWLYVINHIPVESYLEGVLNAEISTRWAMEAIKAQAVVSRTFALYKREVNHGKLWHLSSEESDQVYRGSTISDRRGREAIAETRGIVVTYQGKLAQTFYHSNCGGVTEDPSAIWNTSFPYLKTRAIPYGQSDPRYHWTATFSDSDIIRLLNRAGVKQKKIRALAISKVSPSGRAKTLTLKGEKTILMDAREFRRGIGYKKIQSLLFEVIRIPGGFLFKGRGNGHGVGLSQWSAKEMAEIGYKYHQILHVFYFRVTLRRYSK